MQTPGQVAVIDPASHTVVTSVTVGAQPWSATVSPDDSLLYVMNSRPGTVSVIDWGGPVSEVVRRHSRLDIFDGALGYAMADLGLVVKLRDRFSPRSFIYVHTYGQIFPDGRGFRGLTKAWVQPALNRVGLTDAGQQRELTNWLLAQFARRLTKLVDDNNKNDSMRLVDSLGTLTRPAQWENEIHPTDAGFRLIAEKCWVPALREVLA